jgi:hypothetical protein
MSKVMEDAGTAALLRAVLKVGAQVECCVDRLVSIDRRLARIESDLRTLHASGALPATGIETGVVH